MTKLSFLFLIALAGLNIPIQPAFALTTVPTFITQFEYFEEIPTDPASLVIMITPQDLADEEIYGVSAYFQTDQYELPTPYYSNFNINFQGWGLGDWTCEIGQKSLSCNGDTALETGKKTIVAMYFDDDIMPPDYVATDVLDINGEVIDTMRVGSVATLTNQQPVMELSKEETVQQSGKQNGLSSFTKWSAIAVASVVVFSVAHSIGRKKLPRRKKRRKISKQCPTCNGSGKIKTLKDVEEIVKCKNCENVPYDRCPYCAGTGRSNEDAQGAPPTSQAEMKFRPLCDWCEGTGFKQGGLLKKSIPAFTGAKCINCKGRGYTVQKKQIEKEETCPTCKGSGKVPG